MKTKSKLPKYLGVVGVFIGFSFMAISWYIYKYDPFHLPTTDQVREMPNGYSAPALYWFIEDLEFCLVPGVWLQIFTMDLGDVAAAIIWVFAAFLNYPIYFGLGKGISLIAERIGRAGRLAKT